MKTDINKKEIQAIGYFVAERMQHGENFDAALCIEDIHRMHGKQIADWIEELATIELNRKTFNLTYK